MNTIQDYMFQRLVEAHGETHGNQPHGLTQLLLWHTSQLERFWLHLQQLEPDARVNVLLDVVFQMRVE
jgi:hypothetical protein